MIIKAPGAQNSLNAAQLNQQMAKQITRQPRTH